MGLFKKHDDEYENDFILDFQPVSTAPIAPKEDDAKDSEYGVTPWEQRKHKSAPNSLTPNEILGVEQKEKPTLSDTAVPDSFVAPQKSEPKEEILSETRSFTVPSGEEKEIKPENTKKAELKAEADAIVRSITERKAPEETPAPQKEEAPAPRRDSGLSPKAQELYDRMMAERAKGKLAKIESEIYKKEEPKTEPIEEKTEPKQTPKPLEEETKAVEPTLPTPDTREGESTADAIFESLNDSLNNPLRRHESQSLLSKCKNFVTQEIPINPERSIDDIIHAAELGARKRLSSLYDSGEFPPPTPKPAPKYNFDMFTDSHLSDTTTPDGIDGDTAVINLDSYSEESTFKEDVGKEVKNLQYSLADEPTPPSIDATRVIEPASEGRQADPVKAAEWRKHLEALAEDDQEDEAPTRMYLSGTEEAELPEGEIKESDEKPSLDDYNNFNDAQSVHTDIKSQLVSVTARIIPTAAITVILAVCDFVFKTALLQSATTFILLNTILLALALIINFNTLKGLAETFKGTPDMDSPAALSSSMIFVYTLITAVVGNIADMPTLAPIGALLLLFNLLGKRSMLNRIRRGFEVIATEQEKNAVTFIEDNLSASVMAGGSVVGDALIAIGKSTKNVTNYLKNAYSEDAYEKRVNVLTIFTLIAAAVLAVIAFFTSGLFGSLTAFTLTCAACSPVSSLLICNLPFAIASKKLKAYDAMLAGYTSIESVANANAVAFDVKDLFPAGTIKLYNMQVLNRGAVDKYIASAAALLTAAKSPLAPIFEEILESNGEEMPLIDSIKYENNMGLSGWIEDKRIFVGNRTLMEGHSIKTPSLELDKKILRQGYFPVYLGIGDQLCALFIVGYEADEEITYELRRLCNTGVTMLVNSNDPNVCDEMLCDYFGLYPDSIKVLSPSGSTAYKSAVSFKESISAGASFGDNLCGLLSSITSAINLKSIISILLIVNTILICLSVGVVGYLAFSGILTSISGVLVALCSLLPAAVTALIAYFKQP